MSSYAQNPSRRASLHCRLTHFTRWRGDVAAACGGGVAPPHGAVLTTPQNHGGHGYPCGFAILPPPHCDHLRGEGDTTTAMESHGHERLIEKGVVGAADGNEVSWMDRSQSHSWPIRIEGSDLCDDITLSNDADGPASSLLWSEHLPRWIYHDSCSQIRRATSRRVGRSWRECSLINISVLLYRSTGPCVSL